MSSSRIKKAEKIQEIKKLFTSSDGGVVVGFSRINVGEITRLRNKFRKKDVLYRVIKNTLTRVALQSSLYENLAKLFIEPSALVFGKKDAILAARLAVEFSKDNENFIVKGGFMGGNVLSREQVIELSLHATKDNLLSNVLYAFNAPLERFLYVFNNVVGNFLGVLHARADKLEKN